MIDGQSLISVTLASSRSERTAPIRGMASLLNFFLQELVPQRIFSLSESNLDLCLEYLIIDRLQLRDRGMVSARRTLAAMRTQFNFLP